MVYVLAFYVMIGQSVHLLPEKSESYATLDECNRAGRTVYQELKSKAKAKGETFRGTYTCRPRMESGNGSHSSMAS